MVARAHVLSYIWEDREGRIVDKLNKEKNSILEKKKKKNSILESITVMEENTAEQEDKEIGNPSAGRSSAIFQKEKEQALSI